MEANADSTSPHHHPARAMRASDRDRDAVARILQAAAGEGRITLEELEERLDRTYSARTYAELEPITADLPGGRVAPPSAGITPRRGAEAAQADTPLVIRAKAGTIARRGNWYVPRRVEVSNPYGQIRLDFRHATLLGDVIEIDLHAPWGQAKIILPEEATAQTEIDTSWLGSLDSEVPQVPAPPAPHFRISGNVKGGSVKVRYRRRVDDWTAWADWG
ncbi:DUF1707 domain-containing protein [Streptomonospora sp. S1-112]|uniref:DUF1707 domain-containing protein n=1 Tax=Streptomonospora mangrovi TaxID=2883123 RepID=A0A9X3SDM9_9ACTN|nr:DUF1707 domain-containing protein [Streptomonospora mangrovi]MDA0562830.1 DUF1707 domain-containing protein [Streptomonospora mangrovi]